MNMVAAIKIALFLNAFTDISDLFQHIKSLLSLALDLFS